MYKILPLPASGIWRVLFILLLFYTGKRWTPMRDLYRFPIYRVDEDEEEEDEDEDDFDEDWEDEEEE